MTRIDKINVLVAVLLLAMCLPSAGRAAGNPEVLLFPAETYITPGDMCTLQVYVDGAVDSLSCMEIVLAYDEEIVDCELATEGALYQAATFPTFFDWEQTTIDRVVAIDCVLGYRTYILAPGELARFVFRADGNGSCIVSVPSVRLWDIDRVELDVWVAGEAFIHVSSVSGDEPVPEAGSTLSNYPNPFNPSTTIVLDVRDVTMDGTSYSATSSSANNSIDVDISIFDPAGLLVRRLFAGSLTSGNYRFEWNGCGDREMPVTSGIYFAQARIGDQSLKRKLVLLR